MSHMSRITHIKFLDKQLLIDSLIEQGFTSDQIEVADGNELELIGYDGRTRNIKGCIRIKRKHVGRMSNDLGYVYESDGVSIIPIISDYDKHQYNDKWLGKLKQSYLNVLTQKQLTNRGYRCKVIVTGATKTVVAEKL